MNGSGKEEIGMGSNRSKIANSSLAILLPTVLAILLVCLWQLLLMKHVLLESMFPYPIQVWRAGITVMHGSQVYQDIFSSLWRVAIGFTLSFLLALPSGLLLASNQLARTALLPFVNFLRCLSPLAWIGFSIAWFGVGDTSAIFLIFMSLYFSMTLSIFAATVSIDPTFFRVASEYGITGYHRVTKVLLPAIMPQVITLLRISMGIAWLVVVAAEMVAGRSGLGFAIYDDRNALRQDLLVVHMLLIGIIGLLLDKIISYFSRMPSVQWGYRQGIKD